MKLDGYNIRYTSASTSFNLTVIAVPPVIAGTLNAQVAIVNTPFFFFIDPSAFYDPDGLALTYYTFADGKSSLPSWLHFNVTILEYYGTPTPADIGSELIDFVGTL